ncbi:hypothetical protein D3C75_1191430 [compost metagenome]
MVGEQLFITAQIGYLDVGHARSIAQGDEGFDRRQFRRQFFHQGREAQIEKQVLVFAMVGNELDLLRE